MTASTARLRCRRSGSLHLSLAQETRDYVCATREQFIAARETTRMAVGRQNEELVAMCFALLMMREPMVSARRSGS
jgi:hypothetical protein